MAVTEQVASISSQLTKEVKETSKSIAGTSFSLACLEDISVLFHFVYNFELYYLCFKAALWSFGLKLKSNYLKSLQTSQTAQMAPIEAC